MFQFSFLKDVFYESKSNFGRMIETKRNMELFMSRLEGVVLSLSDRIKSIEEQHTGVVEKLSRIETNERKLESLCERVGRLEASGSGQRGNTRRSEGGLDHLNETLDNEELQVNKLENYKFEIKILGSNLSESDM